jgi:hypothetical protein
MHKQVYSNFNIAYFLMLMQLQISKILQAICKEHSVVHLNIYWSDPDDFGHNMLRGDYMIDSCDSSI